MVLSPKMDIICVQTFRIPATLAYDGTDMKQSVEYRVIWVPGIFCAIQIYDRMIS